MRQFCLPRAARLLKPGDFAALRGNSKRVSARHFLAEFSPTEQPTCRLGQAVSRRVSKRAVDRNRIKRVVRDSYRHVRGDLPSIDILLIARSSAVQQTNAVLRDDLARLWQKFAALKAAAVTGTMHG
jgi:ribonuclease P protein component